MPRRVFVAFLAVLLLVSPFTYGHEAEQHTDHAHEAAHQSGHDHEAAAQPKAGVDGEDSTASHVIVLTDDTFEHETQATTGGTTGDWFVEFYASWCGHCKRLAPVWEQLAHDLHTFVNIAKIEVPSNPKTASRFGISGYPTLKLLKGGQVYEYNGERTVAALMAFVHGGYERVTPSPVPPPVTFLKYVLNEMAEVVDDLKMLFLRKTASVMLIFVVGGLAGVLLCAVVFALFFDRPFVPPPPASASGDGSAVPALQASVSADDAPEKKKAAAAAATPTTKKKKPAASAKPSKEEAAAKKAQ